MTGFDVLGDPDPEDRNPKPEQRDSPLVEAVIPHRVHVVAPVVERPRRAFGPLVCRRWAPAQGRRTLAVVPPVVVVPVVPVVPVFAEREARPVDVEELRRHPWRRGGGDPHNADGRLHTDLPVGATRPREPLKRVRHQARRHPDLSPRARVGRSSRRRSRCVFLREYPLSPGRFVW